jgi:hypothetical protein
MYSYQNLLQIIPNYLQYFQFNLFMFHNIHINIHQQVIYIYKEGSGNICNGLNVCLHETLLAAPTMILIAHKSFVFRLLEMSLHEKQLTCCMLRPQQ